jgi:molecular chaperone GrpE
MMMEEEKNLSNDEPPSGAAEIRPGASEAQAGADGLPADLPAAYRKLLAEKQELFDRLLRKQAELENFRKRLQRDKDEFLQHATAELIRALLPVLDSFDRAMRHRDAAVPAKYYEGLELIHKEFVDVLRRAGLTEIETAGKTFDPHVHQAVETIEATGHRDQEIVEELQRGYKLKHRLLRPAIVKVAVNRAHRPQETK